MSVDRGTAISISKQLTYDARRQSTWRTVTESRLLGILRWGRLTGDKFADGFAMDTLRVLQYRQFYICRAVQAWQLTPWWYATVWIDAGNEGADLYGTADLAVQRFQLLCNGLAVRGVPATEMKPPRGGKKR